MSRGGARGGPGEECGAAAGATASLVLVHYHCAAMAVAACEVFARQAQRTGVELEILVVDNGSDSEGRRRLAAGPGRVLDPGENLGYAGGVNLGAEAATGEVLIFSNADLEPLPGALAALLASLRGGADVAGPRFYWDRERRFFLPPNEARDRCSELAAALAARGPGWARWARRRWRRHARRHWLARGQIPSVDLSGALLAVSRRAWQQAGPFDAGYRLYFEEVDWLHRAAAAGLTCVHQPRAEVVHHYDRSAGGEERSEGWFAESRARFEERWHGPVLRWALDRLSRREPWHPASPPALPPGPPRLDAGTLQGLARRARDGGGDTGEAVELWIEISPLARGFPAAAERLSVAPGGVEAAGPWSLPTELWSALRPGRFGLTVVDGGGRELASASFTGPEGARDSPGQKRSVSPLV